MYLPMSFGICMLRMIGVIIMLNLSLVALENCVFDSLHKQTHSKRWFMFS